MCIDISGERKMQELTLIIIMEMGAVVRINNKTGELRGARCPWKTSGSFWFVLRG
jgi:hypothetical protein